MTPKKNEKKKQKKSMCGALLPSKTSGVERSSPFQSRLVSPLFHLTQQSRRRFRRRRRHYSFQQRLEEDGREFPKTGEHSLARGEESRISGVDVCVARAVEQFRCVLFFAGTRARKV